jgi:CTP synthase
MVKRIQHPKNLVKIAIVGKYTDLHDAYKSIIESFVHAGVENNAVVDLVWIPSEEIEQKKKSGLFDSISGLLIPGGFGDRGIEGKIAAVAHARENDIPFLGICLGLQCVVIEFARSVCGLKTANSTEFNPDTEFPVIDLMPDQGGITRKGGTMRLGAYPCVLQKNSRALRIFGTNRISERHRHRYEVNNDFGAILEDHGMVFSGLSPDRRLVEMVEFPDLRWFVACQFHPEFKSRALRAHPLFRDFVRAALEYQRDHHGVKT